MKSIFKITTLLLVIGLMTGCQQVQNQENTPDSAKVEQNADENNGASAQIPNTNTESINNTENKDAQTPPPPVPPAATEEPKADTGGNEQASTGDKSKEDKLAQCLKEKGVKLYGTEWCGHCKRQKEVLGPNAVSILGFVDCDKESAACTQAGVRGYPTWIVNGESLPGVRELSFIASKAGCTY